MGWPGSILMLMLWALLCALQDYRFRFISNWLTYPAIIAAIVHLIVFQESVAGASLHSASAAVVLVLLLTLPGYGLGMLGAGDIKMLLALGLASGPYHVLWSIAATTAVIVAYLIVRRPARTSSSPSSGSDTPDPATHWERIAYAPFLFTGMIPVFAILS